MTATEDEKNRRGKNVDTAFRDFWKPPERGAFSHRIRTMPLYDEEIAKAIKSAARYAFYNGWQARGKRDQKAKRNRK